MARRPTKKNIAPIKEPEPEPEEETEYYETQQHFVPMGGISFR